MSFTPGPWQSAGPYSCCEHPACDHIVTDGDGKTFVAETAGEDNTRLIAAAPDMLHALEQR